MGRWGFSSRGDLHENVKRGRELDESVDVFPLSMILWKTMFKTSSLENKLLLIFHRVSDFCVVIYLPLVL